MTTTTKITGAQLKDSSVTGVSAGQKVKKHAKHLDKSLALNWQWWKEEITYAYAVATMLIGKANLPSDQRAVGSDCGSRSLLTITQLMQIAYDAISEDSCNDRIALNAAFEPRLISESATVHTSVRIVALTGTCTVLFILPIHLAPGSPLSRANDQACRAHEAVNETLPTMSRKTGMQVRMLIAPIGMLALKT